MRALATIVAAVALALAGAGDARAQSVRIAFPADDGTLTPYTFELGYGLMTLVYDTLAWRDADGVPRPWLARTIETSPDGLTVTARLRPARWHDGRALTAADVAFTFEYMEDRPHPRFTPQLAAIDQVEARGRDTVVFRLRHPSRGFTDQPLADVPILPAHLWRDLPPARSAPPGLPVGSGPYRLVSHDRESGYRLRAYGRYFRGRPAVAAIAVRFQSDFDRAIRALERGRIDMVPAAPPGIAAEGLEREPLRVARGPGYLGTALVLNTRAAPFDRPEARAAVAQAIDVARVAEAAGDAVPVDAGFLHPASRWSSAARRSPASGSLRGLGRVRILAPRGDPAREAAAETVAAMLRTAGVEATAAPTERDRLERATRAGRFQAAITSTPALVSYDPDFLRALFGSDGPLNRSGYRSAEFDAAAERTAAARDDRSRRTALTAELGVLDRDVPAVPLYFSNGAFPYRPRAYDGWVYVKGTGILDKASFLPQRRARPARPAERPAQGGSGIGPLGIAAIVLAVAAALAAAVALVTGRR